MKRVVFPDDGNSAMIDAISKMEQNYGQYHCE